MKPELRDIDVYTLPADLPPLEIRAAEGDKPAKLTGYAIVYDSLSVDLGGFRELIKPGAARKSLDSGKDIRALVDHDHTRILGRTSAGTLRLGENAKGVWVEIDLPDTSYARDLLASVKRRDIRGMSFGFYCPEGGDTFREDKGQIIRDVSQLELVEVTATSIPAYTDTQLATRAAPEVIARAKAICAPTERPQLRQCWQTFRRLAIG